MTLVNLNFMGSRLYTAEKAEAEHARVGSIARALPAFALRNLAYGDLIVLATYKPRRHEEIPNGEPGDVTTQRHTKRPRIGTADAWGSFVVNGVNVKGSEEFWAELLERVHVVKSEERNEKVERECGSYEVVSVHYVRESIRELVDLGEMIADRMGEKVKWFVTGNVFRPLAPHLEINDVMFTRTIVQVELDGWTPWTIPLEAEADGKPLAFIGDYSSRRYRLLSPEEKSAADRRRIQAANAGRLRKLREKFDHIDRDDTGAAA